jgi:hypothetical protein
MKKTLGFIGVGASLILACTALADTPPAKLSAAEIVNRNIAARGGLDAWRAVRTLSWSGTVEAGGNNQRSLRLPGMPPQPAPEKPDEQVKLPFTYEMARARKSRFEVEFAGQTAIQVYDGVHGWKLRPYLNRHVVEQYTPAELEVADVQSDLDGALVDYVAKGTRVELEDVDKVEGRDTYRLKLTLKNKHVVHTWIDAQSFLEIKMEGVPRRLDGKSHDVSIFMRDYRSVGGLKVPYLIETVVQGVQRTEKIEIDKVVVNPSIDAQRFNKPT